MSASKCYHSLTVTVRLSEKFWGSLSVKPGEIYCYLQIFFKNWEKGGYFRLGMGPHIGRHRETKKAAIQGLVV